MKKLLIVLLSLLTAAMLSGCVQMYTETVIEKDGSGTATLKMSLSKVFAESLDEMKELNMDEDQDLSMLEFDKIDKKELENKVKEHGVTIKKLHTETIDGKPTMEIVFDFKDLEGMSFALGSIMGEGGGPGEGMGIFDAGDGNLVLKAAHYDFPELEKEAEAESEEEAETPEMSQEQMQKQMALMGKLMAASAELDVTMKITVPGDIVESNAPETDGRTSIWSINSSNMMTAGANMEPNIVFSGKGLKIKPLTE